ncbi:MAG TPA: TorF family putative porin [Xanthomonadaceae bacterium]|jgi:uncharacterized protein (TIGR02001 family)
MKIRHVVMAGSLALVASNGLHAQSATPPPATPAPTPDVTVTGNAAVVSDYMFRGLTQTWASPAIQGGGDLTLKNGFAAGFWASSISHKSYPGGAMELDLYANYGANFNPDWSWRVGLYGYVYPGGGLDKARPALPSRSFDTFEFNAALTWKWLTLKYNRSLGDYFAIDTEQGYDGNSHGTQYIQLDASVPISDQWSLALHAAHTSVSTELAAPLANGARSPDYNDFGATLKWQFATHWSASAGLTYADNGAFYGHTASFLDPADSRDVGGTRGFVMLQATF